jgi:ribosomal protein L11 methyltransferase
MDLWEAKAELPRRCAEEAERALLENGDGRWSILEDAIGNRAWLVGVFATREEATASWEGLHAQAGLEAAAAPSLQRLAEADWRDSYRAHFRAWTFGRLHWVPVWERGGFRLPPGDSVVWLDPGLAFGTGNHETTRLCIERLVEFERALPPGARERCRAVDAGCGSGILALSAAALGLGEVGGFDLDPEAVRVSRENAALNGLDRRVRFWVAGLGDGLGGPAADVVLANIQADVLAAHVRPLAAAVAPGGLLVLSGILASERDGLRGRFAGAAPGWTVDSRILGEWCDLALRRPS